MPTRSKRKPGPPALLISIVFFTILCVSVFTTHFPILVLGAYAAVSLITFITYAIDKSAAQGDRGRTSERSLHILALLGGWPGAMLAQQHLRHKSKKASFRVGFWFTVILNCAGLVWLHTSEGRAFLVQLLGQYSFSGF